MRIKEFLRKNRYSRKKIIYGNKYITYEELHNKCVALSKQLKVIEDKLIAIYYENSIDYLIAYFSILYADKIIYPISCKNITESLKNELIKYDIKYIATNQNIKFDNCVCFDVNDSLDFSDFTKNNALNHKREDIPDDVVLMLSTSGTSSSAKRVMLTDNNLFKNVESYCNVMNVTRNNHTYDNCLVILPLVSAYSNLQMLVYVFLGAQFIIFNELVNANNIWSVVEKYKVPRFETVPMILQLLMKSSCDQNYDYSSLSALGVGGAKMSQNEIHFFKKRFPNIDLYYMYGMTETSPLIASLDKYNVNKKLGSVGKAVPGVEIKVDTDGEILVRGCNVMKGYYRDDKLTNEIIDNGWLHTGDLGIIDKEGFLYISGRKKNIIISGGINVCPEVVESSILLLKGVINCIVKGEADPLLGEKIVAYVMVEKSSNITSQIIKEHCRKYLEDYQVPLNIYFVNEIEKTETGKNKRFF